MERWRFLTDTSRGEMNILCSITVHLSSQDDGQAVDRAGGGPDSLHQDRPRAAAGEDHEAGPGGGGGAQSAVSAGPA